MSKSGKAVTGWKRIRKISTDIINGVVSHSLNVSSVMVIRHEIVATEIFLTNFVSMIFGLNVATLNKIGEFDVSSRPRIPEIIISRCLIVRSVSFSCLVQAQYWKLLSTMSVSSIPIAGAKGKTVAAYEINSCLGVMTSPPPGHSKFF